jgi:hypothetical protein
MGRIADALRANLRELAQADARLLRDLDAELPVASPAPPAALPDGLEQFSLTKLKQLCKQRGLRGYSSLRKPELLARLRSGDPQTSPTLNRSGSQSGSSLAAIEDRLDRMEALLLQIARHLGVT